MKIPVNFISCFIISLLLLTCGSSSSYLEKKDKSSELKKKRRQVFREDLSPLLGGKIPSGALEWARLMFNNLDSRGISIPDGYLPSNDRIPPEGTRTEESRIRFYSNNMLVPHIETTYTLRSPILPLSVPMAAATKARNTVSVYERQGERRNFGMRVQSQAEIAKMKAVGENAKKHQSNTIQYQKLPTNIEVHVFSPKEMQRIEEQYRNRLIYDILSVIKSLRTAPSNLSLPSTESNPKAMHFFI